MAALRNKIATQSMTPAALVSAGRSLARGQLGGHLLLELLRGFVRGLWLVSRRGGGAKAHAPPPFTRRDQPACAPSARAAALASGHQLPPPEHRHRPQLVCGSPRSTTHLSLRGELREAQQRQTLSAGPEMSRVGAACRAAHGIRDSEVAVPCSLLRALWFAAAARHQLSSRGDMQ